MFVVLALALTLDQVRVGVERSDSARRIHVRDSIRFEQQVRQDEDRRPVRRIPVTPELERTAFKDSSARTLLLRARDARMRQDSSLTGYDATAYQRLSAGLGFRAIGRNRLLFRTENASRVRWSKTNGVLIDLKGRRTAIPMVSKEDESKADMEMDEMSPIPYYPGREALWVGNGMARAEVDENDLVHPIALGAEAYYRYEAGDSLTITLSDGKAIRLRELRIEPRRPEWKFSVGSFWFDQESGQLVRAVYRFSAPMNIWAVAAEEIERERQDTTRRNRGNDDDDVPGWVKAFMSPMEANLEAVTIEYGLYNGRYWLPRTQYVEGYARASFMRVPFKMEESFKYASVNGTDSVPPSTPRVTMRAIRDSLFPDSIPLRDLSPEERKTRMAAVYRVDSVYRAARRQQREESCRTTGFYSDVSNRGGSGARLPTTVRVPCDSTVLAASPELPHSIYDEGEELFGTAERDELLKALDFSLQAGWAPTKIDVAYGVPLSRYNRVEGFSTGVSAAQQLGLGYNWDALARMGTADHSVYGELGIARTNGKQTYRLGAYRRLAVANSDWGSPLSFGASLGALLYGRDEGYFYRASGVELHRGQNRESGFDARVFLERQTTASWNTNFSLSHAFGSSAAFQPNFDAEHATIAGVRLQNQVSRGLDPLGWRLFGSARAEGGALLKRAWGDSLGTTYGRFSGDLTVSRGFGPDFAASITAGAGYATGAPLQRQFFLGGAQTVRGQLLGTRSGDTYWLGRAEFSRATGVVRPVVFGDVGWAGPWEQRNHPGRPISGVGVGASVLDGLIRLDLSRGVYPRQKMRLDLYVEARF